MNTSTPAQLEEPGRVLVVDDVPANVRLLVGILKIAGFRITSASSGAEALELLHGEQPAEVDVVLLDVMMPGTDGFEVCRRLRSNPLTASLPVVMVTALQEVSDRVRALEAGVDDFLTKPVEEIEVVARVQSLVRARRDRLALARAYADLRAAEEMRQFLTQMLVHDLRTPLTTILASLDLLQGEGLGQLSSTQQDVVGMCMKGGQHLLELVNELLDISRLESDQMELDLEELDALSLVQSAASHLNGQARHFSTGIEIEAAPDVPLFQGDGDLLRRVLINLLGNALKFGGHEHAPRVFIESTSDQSGPAIEFQVRDFGEGIAPEDQEHIFSKFAQARNRKTQRKTVSTGLGLTFCKLAVEAHGGRIWVESTLGQGSTFHLRLPAQ